MESCKKCGAALPAGACFCPMCGRSVAAKHTPRKRGNGQGCVYQLPSGKYKAEVTVGYYLDENGKRHRQYRSGVFDRKKDAIAAIPTLAQKAHKVNRQATFKELFDAWFPTHRAGKSTLDCYSAAVKHFRDVWPLQVAEIDVDDLQECLDACPAGKRTRENMRAVVGLYLGNTRMPFAKYLLGGVLGFLPDIVTAAVVGLKADDRSSPWFWGAIAVNLLVAGGSTLFYARYRRRRADAGGPGPEEPGTET